MLPLYKWPGRGLYIVHWDNVWKSRGSIMVNGVPNEVSRPRDFPRNSIHHDTQRLFHTFSLFSHPGQVKRDFSQRLDSLGSIMVNVCS